MQKKIQEQKIEFLHIVEQLSIFVDFVIKARNAVQCSTHYKYSLKIDNHLDLTSGNLEVKISPHKIKSFGSAPFFQGINCDMLGIRVKMII